VQQLNVSQSLCDGRLTIKALAENVQAIAPLKISEALPPLVQIIFTGCNLPLLMSGNESGIKPGKLQQFWHDA
jgi:hypothetical protein